VFRIKLQVIIESGDHASVRGIEGQVMREREKRVGGWEEVTAWIASYQNSYNIVPSG